MELETLQNILKTKKRGQFFTIIYQKVIGDYTKTTTTTIRLVDYNNVKKVKEQKAKKELENPTKTTSTSTPKKSNDIHLGNNLIHNTNTGKTRLQVFLTNHHKPHSVYTYLGNEIDKETYYNGTGEKVSTPDIMFTITIDNIIAVH